MTDRADKKAGVGTAVAVVAAVLVLYVLSVGPALVLYDHVPPSAQTVIAYAYVPVFWLDLLFPAKQPIMWYVNLWV